MIEYLSEDDGQGASSQTAGPAGLPIPAIPPASSPDSIPTGLEDSTNDALDEFDIPVKEECGPGGMPIESPKGRPGGTSPVEQHEDMPMVSVSDGNGGSEEKEASGDSSAEDDGDATEEGEGESSESSEPCDEDGGGAEAGGAGGGGSEDGSAAMAMPIDKRSGEKIENLVDLHVPLVGQDFRLRRSYRSGGNPEAIDPNSTSQWNDGVEPVGLVGARWKVGNFVRVDADSVTGSGPDGEPLVNLGSTDDAAIYLRSESGSTPVRWIAGQTGFESVGQRRDAWDYEVIDLPWGLAVGTSDVPGEECKPVFEQRSIAVWSQVSPEGLKRYYFRPRLSDESIDSLINDDDDEVEERLAWVAPEQLQGLPVAVEDSYGNRWRFTYLRLMGAHDLPGDEVAITKVFVPSRIHYESVDPSTPGEYIPMAEVRFYVDDRAEVEYNGTLYPNPNVGRIQGADAVRFHGTSWCDRTPVVTQRVEYTYFDANNPSLTRSGQFGPNTTLGSDGDLIQVRRSTRLDGSAQIGLQWREQIYQYRYHGGSQSRLVVDIDGDGSADAGHKHI